MKTTAMIDVLIALLLVLAVGCAATFGSLLALYLDWWARGQIPLNPWKGLEE